MFTRRWMDKKGVKSEELGHDAETLYQSEKLARILEKVGKNCALIGIIPLIAAIIFFITEASGYWLALSISWGFTIVSMIAYLFYHRLSKKFQKIEVVVLLAHWAWCRKIIKKVKTLQKIDEETRLAKSTEGLLFQHLENLNQEYSDLLSNQSSNPTRRWKSVKKKKEDEVREMRELMEQLGLRAQKRQTEHAVLV